MAQRIVAVVATAPYPVALDSGRALRPGELAYVPDTERTRRLVADRLLHVVAAPPEPSKEA